MSDQHASSSNTSSSAESQPDEVWTETRESLTKAEELKQAGNEAFKSSDWSEAIVSYRTALCHLPLRKVKKYQPSSRETDPDDEQPSSSAPSQSRQETIDEPDGPLDPECRKARSVLNANIGACFVKLGNHKDAVDACTKALQDDPNYVKALQRRAACNEKIDTWSALSSAQEDYTKVLTLLPPTSPQVLEIERTLRRLEPRVQVAQKKETDEMLDKLKGLGNSVLGRFGLSTDNFKFEPNGNGGYSMNFAR
ncbi:TPR-like protein [Coniophora puteana RWD-64-598 SS2]|uniref:TPR-like protein n=1 Tax=Coniophora puteana (strain RWD-64-598) TaxID=741705 RepID=A0A5M3N6Q7_CONPW|nr:TPR-like protein [Coniophora puteana RWD-64-598 SS2]EIW86541.1 TPR-like protein [Coniophora puteana RWD-64-598 SS2]